MSETEKPEEEPQIDIVLAMRCEDRRLYRAARDKLTAEAAAAKRAWLVEVVRDNPEINVEDAARHYDWALVLSPLPGDAKFQQDLAAFEAEHGSVDIHPEGELTAYRLWTAKKFKDQCVDRWPAAYAPPEVRQKKKSWWL